MKLKDVAKLNKPNSANNQGTIYFQKKKLKKLGMTPEQLMEMNLLKVEKTKNKIGK